MAAPERYWQWERRGAGGFRTNTGVLEDVETSEPSRAAGGNRAVALEDSLTAPRALNTEFLRRPAPELRGISLPTSDSTRPHKHLYIRVPSSMNQSSPQCPWAGQRADGAG